MTALPRDYDAWRLRGPQGPEILTQYIDPPIPVQGFWEAWDDSLGADTSPIGTGATEAEAIDDLMIKLEDGG